MGCTGSKAESKSVTGLKDNKDTTGAKSQDKPLVAGQADQAVAVASGGPVPMAHDPTIIDTDFENELANEGADEPYQNKT